VDTETTTLILQAQRGDTNARNQLFQRWYDRVYNIAWRYFGDDDLASEVCQQVFLSIHQKLSNLREPQAFKGWIYRTAINRCHLENRKRNQIRTLKANAQNGQSNSNAPSPHQVYQQSERSAIVADALQKLSEEQRTIIIMKEYEGLKFREIAELLHISENTAKSRLYYGLKNMRKILEDAQLSNELNYE